MEHRHEELVVLHLDGIPAAPFGRVVVPADLGLASLEGGGQAAEVIPRGVDAAPGQLHHRVVAVEDDARTAHRARHRHLVGAGGHRLALAVVAQVAAEGITAVGPGHEGAIGGIPDRLAGAFLVHEEGHKPLVALGLEHEAGAAFVGVPPPAVGGEVEHRGARHGQRLGALGAAIGCRHRARTGRLAAATTPCQHQQHTGRGHSNPSTYTTHAVSLVHWPVWRHPGRRPGLFVCLRSGGRELEGAQPLIEKRNVYELVLLGVRRCNAGRRPVLSSVAARAGP